VALQPRHGGGAPVGATVKARWSREEATALRWFSRASSGAAGERGRRGRVGRLGAVRVRVLGSWAGLGPLGLRAFVCWCLSLKCFNIYVVHLSIIVVYMC
jgi:hypothetical protein